MENVKKAFETISNELPVQESSAIVVEIAIALRNRLNKEIERVEVHMDELATIRLNLIKERGFMERVSIDNQKTDAVPVREPYKQF